VGQPANDVCAAAVALASEVPYTLNTAGATFTGDPLPRCQTDVSAGVWFTFTPGSNALVEVSTCSSDFDTVLQVYTGSCASLSALPDGCNDDDGPVCFGSQASVYFNGAGGTTYHILVGGYDGETGTLRIRARTVFSAPNDACSGAIGLTAGAPYTMDTAGATSSGDALLLCQTNVGKGVWFTFTPNTDGFVEVSTCGSDFDTVLQIYTGSCGLLAAVPGGCNDDNGPACFASQASVRFSGASGVAYYVLVGGFGSGSGSLRIHARMLSPPVNDPCAGAIALTPGIPLTLDTTNATSNGDLLPACQTNFANGVWFTFTPESDGLVEVSTCGSSFDTAVQAYGGSCGSLSPLFGGCNDENGPVCFGSQASIRFSGTRGHTYYILAGSFGGGSGVLKVHAGILVPPTNDACPGAIALTDSIPYTMDTTSATSLGDLQPGCQTNFGKGVWFTFTPDSNGVVEVNTCHSGFDTALQVYTGSCDSLWAVPGGCNDQNGPACLGSQASVRFGGTGGTTYYILTGGFGAGSGLLQIQARTAPPPPNDVCSGAIVLTPGVPYTMDTAGASSVGDPLPTCRVNFGKGVWFIFAPDSDGLVEVSTCSSAFDTVLQVFAGNCEYLTAVPNSCNDDNGPACHTTKASVRFLGSSGAIYYILAGGFLEESGTLQIQGRTLSPVPNDVCSGAIALTPGTPFALDTAGATSDGGALPTCQSFFGNEVWFSFTPNSDGLVEVSTCGSDFDTVIQVFTGGCGSLSAMPGTCNDEDGPACSGAQASVRFPGKGGATYYIEVGGYRGSSGSLVTQVTFERVCLLPPVGLVSWWPGDGDARDVVGGHHGELSNGTSFIPGLVGQAFRFDGLDDEIRVPISADMQAANNMTVEAWIFPVAPVASNASPVVATTLTQLSPSCTLGWRLFLDSGGRLGFVSSAGRQCPKLQGTSGGSVSLDAWTHVAVTVQDSASQRVVTLYTNGGVTASFATTDSFVPASVGQTLFIGSESDNANSSRRFRGQVDELAIYNRALTQAEIRAVYGARGAGKSLPSASAPAIASMILQPDQSYLLHCNGSPKACYTLQASTNLAVWKDLLRETALGNGSVQFSVGHQGPPPGRFFRLKSP